jgi:hypothetical protein
VGHAVVEGLVERISFIHGSFLEGIGDLDEESFRDSPGAKAPSIAFHLWHTARWADAFQERFGSFAPQLARLAGREPIWDARERARLGLGNVLGKEATGMGLDDDELLLPTADFYDEGGWVVLEHFGWHLTHASRHLGMIEALKGVLGVEGTVTV